MFRDGGVLDVTKLVVVCVIFFVELIDLGLVFLSHFIYFLGVLVMIIIKLFRMLGFHVFYLTFEFFNTGPQCFNFSILLMILLFQMLVTLIGLVQLIHQVSIDFSELMQLRFKALKMNILLLDFLQIKFVLTL